MQLKTSSFRTVFVKNIKRFWPIWASYIVLWILAAVLNLSSSLSWSDELSQAYAIRLTLVDSEIYSTVFTSIFAVLSAMAVFSYLYNSRSTSLIAGLPMRREKAFAANFLSGLVWLIASNIIVAVIIAIVQASFGVLHMGSVLMWFAMVTLQCIFFYGFASFCAMLTGQILTLPLLYAVLNFAVPVVENLVKMISSMFLYGVNGSSSVLTKIFAPIVVMIRKNFYLFNTADGIGVEFWNYYSQGDLPANVAVKFSGWTAYSVYAVAGIVFAVLALLIYRKRHMESAGDIVALRPLKPVFKYCMTFGCALVIGMGIYHLVTNGAEFGSPVVLILCAVIGGFVGYFASEMLMQKSFRVFGRWKGFAVSGLIIIVLLSAVALDVFGTESYIPKANDIKSAYIRVDGDSGVTYLDRDSIDKVIALQEQILEHKDEYRDLLSPAKRYSGYYVSYYSRDIYFIYELENGKFVNRCYEIPMVLELSSGENSTVYALDELINSQTALEQRSLSSIPVTEENVSYSYASWGVAVEGSGWVWEHRDITAEEAAGLYRAVEMDVQNGTIGLIEIVEEDGYYAEQCAANVYIELYQRTSDGEYRNVYIHISPTEDSENTNSYLAKLGIDVKTYTELDAMTLSSEELEPADAEIYTSVS